MAREIYLNNYRMVIIVMTIVSPDGGGFFQRSRRFIRLLFVYLSSGGLQPNNHG